MSRSQIDLSLSINQSTDLYVYALECNSLKCAYFGEFHLIHLVEWELKFAPRKREGLLCVVRVNTYI